VCLRSLTLASLISANLKYRSIAVRIFLIKKALPVLVTKIVLDLVLGLIFKYSVKAEEAALFKGTWRSPWDSKALM